MLGSPIASLHTNEHRLSIARYSFGGCRKSVENRVGAIYKSAIMFQKLFTLLIFCLLGFTATAQDFVCPVDETESGYESSGLEKSGVETCFGCESHTPKTLKMIFHVIRDENGYFNFGPTEEFLLQSIIDVANEKLSANQPASNPGIPNQPVPPIDIQFELAEVKYHEMVNWAFPNIDYPALDPNLLDVFLIEQSGEWFGNGCNDTTLCTGILCCAGGWAQVGNPNGRIVLNRAFYRYVFETILPDCVASTGGDFDLAWAKHYADVLIHEVGHTLTLTHTFSGNDGCEDTPVAPSCSTNNWMDNCACTKGSFTCCQIEKMHDKLESQPYPFVEEDPLPCESDFVIVPYERCSFIFVNTSTPSEEANIHGTTWCIEDLQENPESATDTYTSYNLIRVDRATLR